MNVPRFALAGLFGLLAGLVPVASADTGSDQFDRNVSELRLRLRQLDAANPWVSSVVDDHAIGLYVGALGENLMLGSPGPIELASAEAPLRTFNSYLRYLGQRMRADAGVSGMVMNLDSASAMMDRYVEELNYRLQVLRQASESTGF